MVGDQMGNNKSQKVRGLTASVFSKAKIKNIANN